jgi:protein phosphatase 1B
MGAFLDRPKTEKHASSGSGNGIRYGLSSMQGWRIEMEDAHCARVGLTNSDTDHRLTRWSFFAVFDGHAGSRVSAYCADNLLEAIIVGNDGLLGSFGQTSGDKKEPTAEQVKTSLRSGFLRLDEKLRTLPEILAGDDKSGSTAVCALVSPNHIFLANCGDSRALISRAGHVHTATQDHKPTNPSEKERIQNAGGSVMIQRVNGSLAVSRALGDFEYKSVPGRGPCEQLVSPEPELYAEERNNDDEFIVLACDGVWDVMSNDELCDFIRDRMSITDNLADICSSVLDTCLSKGSRDNMSIVIAAFDAAPKVCDTAKQKEAVLDAKIEAKVSEILQVMPAEATVGQYVMHMLAAEDLEGLPPGGGLNAKRTKIDEIISRLRPSAACDNDNDRDSSPE